MRFTDLDPPASVEPGIARKSQSGPRVLLFAAPASVARVAAFLAGELNAYIVTATHHRQCQDYLQQTSFTLVVIEEAIALENESSLQAIYDLAAEAFVLEVNFGIANALRLIRQLRGAIARRESDYKSARRAAMLSLQRELSATVSGLLLESQLALRTAGPGLAPTLEHLVTLAEALSEQLRL